MGVSWSQTVLVHSTQFDPSNRSLVFSPGTTHASQLRGSWFPVGLDSPAAFHNMLANSQNFMFQKIFGHFPSQNNALALTHHQKALHLARKLMRDPAKHQSNEAVGVIVSFTCHHMSGVLDNDGQDLLA